MSASPRQEHGDLYLQEGRQEIQENVAQEGDEAATTDCQHSAGRGGGNLRGLLRGSAGQDGGLDNLAGGEADISDQRPRGPSQDGRYHQSDGPPVGLQPGYDEGSGRPDDDAESLNVQLISLAVICDSLCFAFNLNLNKTYKKYQVVFEQYTISTVEWHL